MPTPNCSVKEEFLKKWIKGLKTYNACKKEMSITERKNAIKLSADVAMASATGRQQRPALWRRSVMAKTSASKHVAVAIKKRKTRAMKRISRPRVPHDYKRLVIKKRTKVLKGLIPGGECMEDGNTLIKETLDYILALRVQVDVMRQLVSITEI